MVIYRIFNLGTLILVKIQWYNEHCFPPKGWKSRHVIHKIFTRETMKTRKAEMCFEAKFGSGEIMSSWETDDRRGDYLLYLHLLASTFLARALSFPFCIRLDDVFRYEEKLFKLSWSFQSSICHKVVILSGITDYFMTTKLKCYFWSYRITRRRKFGWINTKKLA